MSSSGLSNWFSGALSCVTFASLLILKRFAHKAYFGRILADIYAGGEEQTQFFVDFGVVSP